MWNMQLGATLEVSVWDSSGSKGVVTTPNPGATWRQISLLLSNPRFCLDYFLLPADHVSALLNFLALGKSQVLPREAPDGAQRVLLMWPGVVLSCPLHPPAPRRGLIPPGDGVMLLMVDFNFLCQKQLGKTGPSYLGILRFPLI